MEAVRKLSSRLLGAPKDGERLKSDDLRRHHLSSWQDPEWQGLPDEAGTNQVENPLAEKHPQLQFKNPGEKIRGHIIQNDSKAALRDPEVESFCLRSNVCRKIWWEPSQVKAAIVTCGHLCPGVNSVVRGLTNTLHNDYGVQDILGMQNGYIGMSDPVTYPPIRLTPELVRNIHMKGGSILKAGQGGFEAEKILDNLAQLGVNVAFLVGGPGTQSAGLMLYDAARKRGQPLSIVGVPKSIDNDIVLFDKTFGFESAVDEAAQVLRNGWVEASSCTKGVGIVKLMGRSSGWVALQASLASGNVDLCLIPEVVFKMEDVMNHIDDVLERQGFMVIAIAEGAGREHVAMGEKDTDGNPIYGDIGTHLRDAVNAYLKPKGGRSFYIDPSKILRSRPAGAFDHFFCSRLAIDAVHSAMRGYTGVCVGPMHDVICMMPASLVAGRTKRVNPKRSAWSQCVQACNIPSSLSGFVVE